jgi:hypothetical protein
MMVVYGQVYAGGDGIRVPGAGTAMRVAAEQRPGRREAS